MKHLRKLGAVLMFALVLVAAAVFFLHGGKPVHLAGMKAGTLLNLLYAAGFSIAGITITYSSFQHSGAFGDGYTGGTTAPTAAQSYDVSLITATVILTDTDTTFTLTHNWGLTAAQIAALLPLVTINIKSGVQGVGVAVMPVIAVDVSNANAVVFTKLQATGSGCTLSIAIRRPHTLGF